MPFADNLRWFLVAGAMLLVAAQLRRASVLRSARPAIDRRPTPVEVAFLIGGPARAAHAALAGLRAAGWVGVSRPGVLASTGPAPRDATGLDHAVHAAADRHRRPGELRSDPQVAAALDAVRADLVGAGWLSTSEQRARVRHSAWPVLALAAAAGCGSPSTPGSTPAPTRPVS